MREALRSVLRIVRACVLAQAAIAYASSPVVEDPASIFLRPPAEARPWVYWFWSDGNLTREGITADLEAMARVGIGGVLIMEVDQGVPAGPVRFMSPAWREMFRFVMAEADRLGLEVCMNNDGGWTGSGGPWVTPEHAMQMVVWTRTQLQGPLHFQASLPRPLAVRDWYRDIAVLAFPTPPDDLPLMSERRPAVTAVPSEGFEAAAILDGNRATCVRLANPGPDRPPHVQFEFAEPFAARSVSVGCDEWQTLWGFKIDIEIQVSDDGTTYRRAAEARSSWPLTCINFQQTSALFYRVVFRTNAPRILLSEVELHAAPRIQEIAGKAGYVRQDGFAPTTDPAGLAVGAVPRESILDLTARMTPDGRLDWDVPDGAWTVLRIGHTPTGRENSPAPRESIGLECDKLSREAVQAHFSGFIGRLVEDRDRDARRCLKYTHIDSWEVGSQNWTPGMRVEFQARRGYDPVPFLTTLTGRYVDDVQTTERFLRDLRRTIADLLAENYAGGLAEIAGRHGLQLSIEAYGDCLMDNLACAGRCDIPMTEFWVGGGVLPIAKAMASAAHTHGRPLVAAEAFTAAPDVGRWQDHPAALKPLGDRAFCLGVNRFVIHRYAAQPWLDRVPGMTMGPWGIHFERTSTWWDKSGPWLDYLARCQALLQRGLFVADIAWLCGEDAPSDLPPREHLRPAIPPGYDFDGCTAETVLERMSVRDGRLVLPDGMSYRLLVLPSGDSMTPGLLRRIGELVEAGATVVGSRPTASPSLEGYPDCDAEVRRLADRLWTPDGGGRAVGQGCVISGKPLGEVLSALNLPPDFECEDGLQYIHRRIGSDDVYFVANPETHAVATVAGFRVGGRRPELWDPMTGRIVPAAMYACEGERTTLPLRLEAGGSIFVVFRNQDDAFDPVAEVARGGHPLLRASRSGLNALVKRAVYGVLDDPARCRDVRDRVQRLADEGRRRFVVSTLAVDGDPAPGTVKTLVVEYVIEGRPFSITGLDEDVVEFNENPAVITVEKAVYGPPGDAGRTLDFTDRLRHLVATGRRSFPYDAVTRGAAPAFLVVKTLHVDYTVDGRRETTSCVDGGSITLIGREARDPGVQVGCDADGRPVIEVAQPGVYEVRTASGAVSRLDARDVPDPMTLMCPWELTFQPGRGAPPRVTLDRLVCWTEHPDPGVRYFSGAGMYRATIDVPAERLGPDRRLYLDLGRVCVLAEVRLNARPIGVLWNPPFVADITDAARPGANDLEIEVVNLWPNRLIGDEQLPDDCTVEGSQIREWPAWLLEGRPSPTGRLTFATWRHYRKDSPLQPSGLIGPVRLLSSRVYRVGR